MYGSMLTYAYVCRRMLTYAGVCLQVCIGDAWERVVCMECVECNALMYADVCVRMLTYAGVCLQVCIGEEGLRLEINHGFVTDISRFVSDITSLHPI